MQAHPELACASVDSRLSFGSRMRETDARLRNIIYWAKLRSLIYFIWSPRMSVSCIIVQVNSPIVR
jgi:hypothetical protein